jgi:hypothetical protein
MTFGLIGTGWAGGARDQFHRGQQLALVMVGGISAAEARAGEARQAEAGAPALLLSSLAVCSAIFHSRAISSRTPETSVTSRLGDVPQPSPSGTFHSPCGVPELGYRS